MDPAIVIALAALVVSLIAFWQTYLRRGSLSMTRPSLIFIGREGSHNEPKVFLRALLFSTGRRGWMVEQLFLRVHQRAGTFLFDFWAYGEREKLHPGSGIFVGEQGVVYNFHFNQRSPESDFLFLDGEYRIEVYACLFGRKRARKLHELTATVRSDQAAELIQIADAALFFVWDVDVKEYVSRVERRPSA